MARLRYNGLSTTLGGSLTSGATSVTFAAALTHSNGTNVPTIVSPDYIPLAILGATGHLSEIVYLTAYAAGATTGTIARGVEGTTGAAHSSGDAVTQAPLVADYTGEGGGDYFRSGFYSLGTWGNLNGTTSLVLNTLFYRPFIVPVARTFDRIGVSVSVAAAAGGVIRMGIYSGVGIPTALILDAGTVASTSTGAAEITISQALNAGVYWVACVSQTATATIASPSASSNPFASPSATVTASNATGYSTNSVSGALPSSPTPATSASNPGIWLRAA